MFSPLAMGGLEPECSFPYMESISRFGGVYFFPLAIGGIEYHPELNRRAQEMKSTPGVLIMQILLLGF